MAPRWTRQARRGRPPSMERPLGGAERRTDLWAEDHMIELAPGSFTASSVGLPPNGHENLGEVQLTGEIVDSKCYFGVMNPGAGKVHRDCAVHCISGGIPPAFLVRDSAGNTVTLLLANWKRELLEHIAKPVTIRGRLSRSTGRLTLYQE